MAARRSRAIQVYKRFGLAVAVTVFGIYAVVNLTGPQGVTALFSKWDELRRIEVQNANLASELKERKERIRILTDSLEERELEIRKKLQKLRPGEKLYQVPDPEPTSPAKPEN